MVIERVTRASQRANNAGPALESPSDSTASASGCGRAIPAGDLVSRVAAKGESTVFSPQSDHFEPSNEGS